MDIATVLAESDLDKRIKLLKAQVPVKPEGSTDLTTILKEWNPATHTIITDLVKRPNKTVYVPVYDDQGNPVDGKTQVKTVQAVRVALPAQKLIVNRAVSFLFGNPVKINSDEEGDDQKVKTAIERMLKDNRSKSHDRKIAKNLFITTETAEYWFAVKTDKPYKKYGFQSKGKVKCKIFSALTGDELFPFFEANGEMTAFSRGYKVKTADGEIEYFETWTKEQFTQFKKESGQWVNALAQPENGDPVDFLPLAIKKIPIVYANQEQHEWKDVQILIDRIEVVLSNLGETNDYHASPKMAVSGEVKSFIQKGEAGGILQLEDGAKAEYVAWQQAPESVKLELEQLFQQMYAMSQTPNISFEAVKGIGAAASGTSLELLFLDPHLKVQDKMEIFDELFPRRLSILKEFYRILGGGDVVDDVELTAEVLPYMVDDTKDVLDNIVASVTGGIMSKETGVRLNPLILDSKGELDLLATEQEAELQRKVAENTAPVPEPAQ